METFWLRFEDSWFVIEGGRNRGRLRRRSDIVGRNNLDRLYNLLSGSKSTLKEKKKENEQKKGEYFKRKKETNRLNRDWFRFIRFRTSERNSKFTCNICQIQINQRISWLIPFQLIPNLPRTGINTLNMNILQ